MTRTSVLTHFLVLPLLVAACTACGAPEQNALLGKSRVLTIEGPVVTAAGIYLSGDDGEQLLQLLARPGVEQLDIGYVPGGLALVGYKLANRLAGKRVVITGPCASACANAVVAAASITFAGTRMGEMPPMLVIHGLFRQTGDRIENAKEANQLFAKRLNARFPYLAVEHLNEALGYPMGGISGLVIAQAHSGGLDFSLCQPWPARCRSVHRIEQGSL
jgi:hypothetical protein